jgi:hypothetical protein
VASTHAKFAHSHRKIAAMENWSSPLTLKMAECELTCPTASTQPMAKQGMINTTEEPPALSSRDRVIPVVHHRELINHGEILVATIERSERQDRS